MNDITPPKSTEVEQNSSNQSHVATNVGSTVPTNVGKPVRHWGRIVAIVVVVIIVLGITTTGVLYIVKKGTKPALKENGPKVLGPLDNKGKEITDPKTLEDIRSTYDAKTETKELPR